MGSHAKTRKDSRTVDHSTFGFTLVEMLAAIVVLATLMALLFPSLGQMLENSRTTQCAGNLRQIGVLLLNYMNDNGRCFPHPQSGNYDGWIEELENWHGTLDRRMFSCPQDKVPRGFVGTKRTYAVNEWYAPFGTAVFSRNTSQLIMLSERATSLSVIGEPGCNDMWQTADITPLHGKTTYANILFADGHVEFVLIDLRTQYWGSLFWTQHFMQQ
jgi:prepilin-type processing-associated H-X9-DG protein/prepilin-type N-terminal cleavage/methylation domain-containing protein